MINKILDGRVIGIAGPSCCGKSTIVTAIASTIKDSPAPFHLDKFWISGAEKTIVNGEPSYERPDQYDGLALLSHINRERSSCGGTASRSSFSLVEGFVLFLYPEIFRCLDTRIYLNLTEEEMVRRRTVRAGTGGDPVNGGGERSAIERSFFANGIEEWRVNGGPEQEFMDGVHVVDAGRPVEEVFCDVLDIIMRDALADMRRASVDYRNAGVER